MIMAETSHGMKDGETRERYVCGETTYVYIHLHHIRMEKHNAQYMQGNEIKAIHTKGKDSSEHERTT